MKGKYFVDYMGRDIDEMDGDFEITMTDVECRKWVGSLFQSNVEYHLEINTFKKDIGIFGWGFDDVGPYLVRGDSLNNQPNGKEVRFIKAYINHHTVLFIGKIYDTGLCDNTYRMIEGKYQFLDTNITGEFKIFEILEEIPNDEIRANVGEFNEHILQF